MLYQCIKKCYWRDTIFSPQPDGKMTYEGPEKLEDLPHSKSGEPYFKPAEIITVMGEVEPKRERPKVWEPTQEVLAKWALQKLNKAELQTKLRREYHQEVDSEITRKELIDKILVYQVQGQTSQEIANVTKAV